MLRGASNQCADRYEPIQESGVGAWHPRFCQSSSSQRIHPCRGAKKWTADIISLQHTCWADLEERVQVAASIDSINTCGEWKLEEIEKNQGANEPSSKLFIKSYLIIGI